MFSKLGLLLVTFSLLTAVSVSIDPPVWPNEFTQEYVVQNIEPTTVASGKIWYDYTNKKERKDVKNAEADLFCNSVDPDSKSPCSMLMTKGIMYIVFPEQKKCCECCTEEEGCGMTKPDTYKDYKYVGEEDISGESFYKWEGKNVYYYARKDAHFTPRRYLAPNFFTIDYIMNTYTIGPVDQKVFEIPSYCSGKCPHESLC